MLRNERGYYVDHTELYPLLGLVPGRHLPDQGFEKTIRLGLRVVTYRCEPVGSPGQRVKFQCDCGRWIPFGRAGQHLKVCKEHAAAEFALGYDTVRRIVANG